MIVEGTGTVPEEGFFVVGSSLSDREYLVEMAAAIERDVEAGLAPTIYKPAAGGMAQRLRRIADRLEDG